MIVNKVIDRVSLFFLWLFDLFKTHPPTINLMRLIILKTSFNTDGISIVKLLQTNCHSTVPTN